MYPKTVMKRLRTQAMSAILFVGLAGSAVADEALKDGDRNTGQVMRAVPVDKDYALGLARFDLDAHTEILGWQVADRWYFGRQDGEDSGLTLVWQAEENQVSLSKDGVRLTRRF